MQKHSVSKAHIFPNKEDVLKKISILMAVIMLTMIASTAMARSMGGWHHHHETKTGNLFLFQKCDAALFETTEFYDEFGCPNPSEGPWPILSTERWGQMQYNVLGDKFRFSFEGKKLVPDTDYTLIYYPDPWPGENLICLGNGTSNKGGNLQIHGDVEIIVDEAPSGLPASYDGNFKPASESSGAVGAKIWLVRSADVDCSSDLPQMIGWTPQDYLFEGNLIVYQYSEEKPHKFHKR